MKGPDADLIFATGCFLKFYYIEMLPSLIQTLKEI